MEKLNFIIDLEYAIKPIWFFVIPMLIYLFILRNKFKKVFANLFIPSNDSKIEENNTSINTVNNLFILIEIAFLVIYIFAIWDLMLVDKNIKDFGQWGDFFGGIVNPILTFITFIALLITIVLQQIELKESREEFKKSAEALTKQEEHMELQTFENTFFKMVELHNNIVDNLSFEKFSLSINGSFKKDFKGRQVLEEIFNKVFNNFFIHKNKSISFDYILKDYWDMNLNENYILGHYFRNLYQILKFLKSKEEVLGKDELKSYANILRSQLSSYELILLFINCFDKISDNGEFRKLLIHYSFLQHIPFVNINKAKIDCHMNIYKESALLNYKENNDCIEISTLKDIIVIIPSCIFCQYFENGKSAFDGNEVVEKIKPYIECSK